MKLVKSLLSIAMVISLAACQNTSSDSSSLKDGTYTGTGKGHSSDVTVTITVSEGKINEASVDLSGETESVVSGADTQLVDQILKAQSAEIDGVSGATESSNAVKTALADALAQATGTTVEKGELTDGTYTATAASFGVKGLMKGEVTVKDDKLSDIKITEEYDSLTGQWFEVAEELLIPRILEAQSTGVDAITGATTSSGAIKAIVSDAIEQAGGSAAQWSQPVAKSNETVKLEGYDVIVVGLGGSGILSYCAAADNGATVFGLDAAGQLGGNSASVYGPMALNSENLKAKYTNGEDYINEDDVYNTWIEYVGTDEKADVIHRAVYESGSAVDYYMDNFDFSFDGMGGLLGSFVVPEWTHEWTVYTADNENTKWYEFGPDHTYQFINAMEKAKGMNDKNDYQLELTGTSLITDDNGNVIGVNATSYDGTAYEIYGKSVILATGGFLGNDEMMNEVYGSTIHSIGDTVNDGTGIKMGQSVGGATYALATLPMIHVSQVPNIIRDDSLTADQKAILSALAVTTDALMVDENGNVLGQMDESGTTNSELTVGIAFAPGFHYYTVYSQQQIEQMKAEGLSETTAAVSIFGLGQGGTVPVAGTPISDIDTIMQVAIDTNNAYKGTASELAKALNMDESTLTATLGDSETVYYLVECAGYSYGTVGGLDVDVNMNVLTEDGTAIANLFAVGQDSEGVANADGKAYSPWGGQAQSWTFVSGKIAGEAAANYAKAQ